MKLLHVYSGNLFGGVERMLVTLATTAPAGATHEFALTSEGQLQRELEGAGARVMALGGVRARRPDTVWRARLRLRGLLAGGSFDAVICHSAWCQALFAAEAHRAGIRQIFWLHDAANGGHWIETWAARHRPDLAIANSEFTRSTLGAMYRGCASAVIHCPVPAPAPQTGARDRVRAEMGVEPGQTVILQASRLQAWKGHTVLLGALSRLAHRRDWTCWIAGGASTPEDRRYADGLRALADGGRARFLGHRTDVAGLMTAADVFCQPNLRPEPFGIALVEALWSGLPAVTSAAGGALEVVTPETGWLVKPGCAAALAEALEESLERPDLRARLGARGPERAREVSDPAARQAELIALAGASDRRAAA